MTALAQAVLVDGQLYAAGTDHTAMPATVVDRIRNPLAWVGGVAPTLSVTPGAGKAQIIPADLTSPAKARAALGLGTSATRNVGTGASDVAAGNAGSAASSTGTYAARPAAAAGNAGTMYISTDAGAARSDGSSWARFTAVPRWEKWNPAGSVACNVDRSSAVMGNNTGLLTSGRLQLAGGFVIPAGATVSSISFMSGNVAVGTPTNYWFVLADINRNVLGKTADATTAAWGGNAVKTLTLTTPWTATADTAVYTGLVVVATTMPDLRGTNGSAPVNGVAPMTCASADTGLTTPASLGSTIGTLTSSAVNPFSYVS